MSAEAETRAALLAALAWQVELGADEAIEETPVDRFALAAAAKQAPAPAEPASHEMPPEVASPNASRPDDTLADDPHATIHATPDLAALDAAARSLLAAHAGGARMVFAEGTPAARLMVVADAPEGDAPERVMGGRAGGLLDRMLAAIGRAREAEDPRRGAYLASLLPWPPLVGRAPSAEEVALTAPILARRLVLARPRAVLVLGNAALAALTGETGGLRRARGRQIAHEPSGARLIASFSPRALLERPERKREAWADLLTLAEALEG